MAGGESLGNVISSETDVGPAAAIILKAGDFPYLSLSCFTNANQRSRYTRSHGMGSFAHGAMVRSIRYVEQIGLCSFQGPFRRKKTGEDVELHPFLAMISRQQTAHLASTNPVFLGPARCRAN